MRISFLRTRRHERLCFFQSGDGLLSADSRVLLQEFIKRIPAFQVVQEGLERHACSSEDRLTAKDFWIPDDYALKIRSQGEPPSQILIISPITKNRREKCNPPMPSTWRICFSAKFCLSAAI